MLVTNYWSFDDIEPECCCVQWWTKRNIYLLHSKNVWVKRDPERVHWGQTPFQINDDPEISQPDTEYDPELRQCDLIICQVCEKLTDFRSLAPMDLFLVNYMTRAFLECIIQIINTITMGNEFSACYQLLIIWWYWTRMLLCSVMN